MVATYCDPCNKISMLGARCLHKYGAKDQIGNVGCGEPANRISRGLLTDTTQGNKVFSTDAVRSSPHPTGLLDTVEAENRVVGKYKAEAEKRGYVNMVAWCEIAKEWCVAAQNVLGFFSKEEQLFIQDMRNSLVHGWLYKPHLDRFKVKYFNGKEIVTEEIDHEDYHDIIKVPLLGVRDGNIVFQKGLDEALGECADKLTNKDLDFWKIVNWLNSDGVIDNIHKQIYSDINVNFTPGQTLKIV